MADIAIEIRELVKRFGGLIATDHVSLGIHDGEVHAVIGPNGAGKTTLISQLTGELVPNAGQILMRGRNITRMSVPHRARLGIARSFQITSLFKDFSVLDNVALAVQCSHGHSFKFWRDARKDEAIRSRARDAIAQLHLTERAETLSGNLSYGEQRRLEIAMALATDPSVLLLDEPMAGMGHEESGRMIEVLRGLKGRYAMLLVEHDMSAVFALADRITVLVNGAVLTTGTPDEIRTSKEVRRAYLGEEKPGRRKAAQEIGHG
jgi:branched-chain amino acid transport system ATP-binding protein